MRREAMNISPEDLDQKGYTVLDRLHHKELMPFILTYLKKSTRANWVFLCCNLICLILIAAYSAANTAQSNLSLIGIVRYMFYGFAFILPLIPVHEYIHVLAYRSQGAKDTSYDVDWSKLIFMAIAHRFVASRKEFRVVALAPFIAISAALLLALPFVSPAWGLAIASALLLHTSCCLGDIALLSYFEYHKDKKVVTYDDKENKLTWFLAAP